MPASSAHAFDLPVFRKGQLSCTLDRAQALTYLGHRGQTVNDALAQRFEALAQRCENTLQARYAWLVTEIREGTPTFLRTLDGSRTLELPGTDIARHLTGARFAVLLAATLGSGCEQELRQLKSLNTLDFIMYDSCASALTEAAANAIHDQLAHDAQRAGLIARARFGPGYGDLPLQVQPDFLRILDATKVLGMTTNENHFLVPTKSITAIIGLFDKEAPDFAESVDTCAVCPALTYCSFRERGTTCHG